MNTHPYAELIAHADAPLYPTTRDNLAQRCVDQIVAADNRADQYFNRGEFRQSITWSIIRSDFDQIYHDWHLEPAP